MRYAIGAILLLFGSICSQAHATTTIGNVNCRARPTTSARVVARLQAGTRVAVMERRSSWARVLHTGRGCWVSARYLSEQGAAEANRVSLAEVRSVSSPRSLTAGRLRHHVPRLSKWGGHGHRAARRYSRSRRIPNYSYGGSCPCSGRNICIGPRGGRYCITSGGNKRYGV
ncbi:SH3 domain-containing protein [Sphingomonas beigongshangi]|uniref:SH3 domain-containing protein n=1 Tax=Sphingomonas beigongshangi TaxID=2782540 RepID=UPI001AEE9B3E